MHQALLRRICPEIKTKTIYKITSFRWTLSSASYAFNSAIKTAITHDLSVILPSPPSEPAPSPSPSPPHETPSQPQSFLHHLCPRLLHRVLNRYSGPGYSSMLSSFLPHHQHRLRTRRISLSIPSYLSNYYLTPSPSPSSPPSHASSPQSKPLYVLDVEP